MSKNAFQRFAGGLVDKLGQAREDQRQAYRRALDTKGQEVEGNRFESIFSTETRVALIKATLAR